MTVATHLSRRSMLGAGLASLLLPAAATAQAIDPNNQEPSDMRVRFTFNGMTLTAVLYDNPTAREFYAMLPLDLTISDFGGNEKIAYLPRNLTEDGNGPFDNEQPYDLCYYMPWGNLAMFHGLYPHTGLVRLGRFEEGREALHVAGEFPLQIEAI
jgi:hypothetical protein